MMIHVDLKNDQLKRDLKQFVNDEGWTDVYFVEKRRVVTWGHSSILAAQQQSFKELMELTNWDHVILLGTDYYPLATPDGIAAELSKYRDMTCIGHIPESKTYQHGSWQWNTSPWVEAEPVKEGGSTSYIAGHILKYKDTFKLDIFKDIRVYGGLQWIVFSRKYLNSMFTSPHAVSYHARMEWIFAPEEFLYHTWGFRFVPKHLVDDLKIYYDWPKSSPSNPIILGEKHVSKGKIVSAIKQGKLYMRKVDMAAPAVMDFVDKNIFNIEHTNTGKQAKKWYVKLREWWLKIKAKLKKVFKKKKKNDNDKK
jgi:hypothetical protein